MEVGQYTIPRVHFSKNDSTDIFLNQLVQFYYPRDDS